MEAIHEHDALQDAAALGLLLANPHVYLKELEEGERRHLADPFAVGRWVKLHGLKRQALNNCVGMIIRDANGQGRVGVRLQHCGDKLVKTQNLQPFPEEELVKIARY